MIQEIFEQLNLKNFDKINHNHILKFIDIIKKMQPNQLNFVEYKKIRENKKIKKSDENFNFLRKRKFKDSDENINSRKKIAGILQNFKNELKEHEIVSIIHDNN